MSRLRDDPDPYTPIVSVSHAVPTCDKCKGLRTFCNDAGYYHCTNCGFRWQHRSGGGKMNSKALYHFQGNPYRETEGWPVGD